MKVTYKIFRTSNRDIKFNSIESLGEYIPGLDAINELNVAKSEFGYECVYESEIEVKNNTDKNSILNFLLEKFNLNHPEDFRGHSLSVSDIIQLNDEYHYVDSFGFQQLACKVDA